MFDNDMQIHGKYATYWKALSQLPGNAVETSKNFKIFENYIYVYMVCRKLFPAYAEQQFLAMFGMLTGTASSGVILLREIDGDFKTPVADNLVYQNFPAMVFGFPILLLATMAPTKPYLTLGIVAVFMVAINILLFRSLIFRKKKQA